MAFDKIATQIRISEELHDKLKAIAKAEGRSINNMIVYFLSVGAEEYINAHPNMNI